MIDTNLLAQEIAAQAPSIFVFTISLLAVVITAVSIYTEDEAAEPGAHTLQARIIVPWVCVLAIAVPTVAWLLGIADTNKEMTKEIQQVNRMIPAAVKSDYRVTDVASDLTRRQILAAASDSRLDAPTITVVTPRNQRVHVGLELDPETGTARLISNSTSLNPADLRR